MARLCTNCEGVWGPFVKCKWVPDKSGRTRVRCAAWLKKARKKRVMKRMMKKLWQRRMYRLRQKKSWKKLTWGLTHKNQDLFQSV